MCDYSLAVLPNRLAVEGEELVVHRFHTGAKGLAAPADLRAEQQALRPVARKSFWEWLKGVLEDSQRCSNVPAVCVPPGAHLLLKNIPEEFQRQWRTKDKEHVVFMQVSAAENTFRDAVQFHHEREVLMQNLPEGILVQVLSLGGMEVGDEEDIAARPFKPVTHLL